MTQRNVMHLLHTTIDWIAVLVFFGGAAILLGWFVITMVSREMARPDNQVSCITTTSGAYVCGEPAR